MKYLVQSNHGQEWKTISSDRAGHQEFDELEQAMKSFNRNVNMARCIWDMRVIDQDDVVCARYNPEQDTRLPGPRHRLIRKLASKLWTDAGCPSGLDLEFWCKAERELPENNGVCIY
jgi:hypothetical protein